MEISAILAIDAEGGVARGGKLPWWGTTEGRWDMAHFVRQTHGHAVVMGRATWSTLKKPLSGRLNLVLTRDAGYQAKGAVVVNTPEHAVAMAKLFGKEQLWVIGGPTTYRAFAPRVDRWVVTRFSKAYGCDLRYTPPVRGDPDSTTEFNGGKLEVFT